MKHNQPIFLLTVMIFCFCILGCRDKKTAILDSMAKLNEYEGNNTAGDSGISSQWKNYLMFTEIFSDSELVSLCDHKNPIIRTYAFRRLIDKKDSSVFKILVKHLSDTGSFSFTQGCLVGVESVNEAYLEMVEYQYLSNISNGVLEWNYFPLNKEQYEFVDSVMLFQHGLQERNEGGLLKHWFYESLFSRLHPIPAFHERVFQIVSEGVYEALPLLARYRNTNDTALFKQLLKLEEKRKESEFIFRGTTVKASVRMAVIYFPHPSFYPILKEKIMAEIGNDSIPDKDESYPLYLAIVQYPTVETKKLLEMSLKRFDAGHYKRSAYINDAIQKYPSKVFDSLEKFITNKEDF